MPRRIRPPPPATHARALWTLLLGHSRDLGALQRHVVHEPLLPHHEAHDRLVEFRRVHGGLRPHIHQHHRPIHSHLPSVRRPEIIQGLLLEKHEDDVLLLGAQLKPDRARLDVVVPYRSPANAESALAVLPADPESGLVDVRQDEDALGVLEEFLGPPHLAREPSQGCVDARIDLLRCLGLGDPGPHHTQDAARTLYPGGTPPGEEPHQPQHDHSTHEGDENGPDVYARRAHVPKVAEDPPSYDGAHDSNHQVPEEPSGPLTRNDHPCQPACDESHHDPRQNTHDSLSFLLLPLPRGELRAPPSAGGTRAEHPPPSRPRSGCVVPERRGSGVRDETREPAPTLRLRPRATAAPSGRLPDRSATDRSAGVSGTGGTRPGTCSRPRH